MTRELENLIDRRVEASRGFVRRFACSSSVGEEFEIMVDVVSNGVSEEYLRRKRSRKNVRPETMARYESEAAEAGILVRDRMRRLYIACKRKREMALIEFPALQIRVSEGLGKRGIPFLFTTREFENVITVRVIGSYFLEVPVTLQTVDRAVSLMRYFIDRPEYAREEMPEVRTRQSSSLARRWDSLTAGGEH